MNELKPHKTDREVRDADLIEARIYAITSHIQKAYKIVEMALHFQESAPSTRREP